MPHHVDRVGRAGLPAAVRLTARACALVVSVWILAVPARAQFRDSDYQYQRHLWESYDPIPVEGPHSVLVIDGRAYRFVSAELDGLAFQFQFYDAAGNPEPAHQQPIEIYGVIASYRAEDDGERCTLVLEKALADLGTLTCEVSGRSVHDIALPADAIDALYRAAESAPGDSLPPGIGAHDPGVAVDPYAAAPYAPVPAPAYDDPAPPRETRRKRGGVYGELLAVELASSHIRGSFVHAGVVIPYVWIGIGTSPFGAGDFYTLHAPAGDGPAASEGGRLRVSTLFPIDLHLYPFVIKHKVIGGQLDLHANLCPWAYDYTGEEKLRFDFGDNLVLRWGASFTWTFVLFSVTCDVGHLFVSIPGDGDHASPRQRISAVYGGVRFSVGGVHIATEGGRSSPSPTFQATFAPARWHFERAEEEGTTWAYEAHLDRFPRSPCAAEARARIETLRDEQSWADAHQSGTEEAYLRYLEQHPDGAYRSTAQARLEEGQWGRTWREGTEQAYESYLARYPAGLFADQARWVLQQLRSSRRFREELDANIDDPVRYQETLVRHGVVATPSSYIPWEEDRLLRLIQVQGPVDRYVIPELKPGPTQFPGFRATLMEDGQGRVHFQPETPRDTVQLSWTTTTGSLSSTSDGGIDIEALLEQGRTLPLDLFLSDGAIHRYQGTVHRLDGYTFVGEGEKEQRLTFVMLPWGYTYLRGEGRVILPSGEEVAFP